jgi:2-oxopent-4-enoate hydratase
MDLRLKRKPEQEGVLSMSQQKAEAAVLEERKVGPEEVCRLAERIYRDEQESRMGPPPSEQHPEMTVADAYAVQLGYISRRMAAGAQLRGHKVGCTNPVIQRLFNVYQPDYGQLLDDMVLPGGVMLSMSKLIQPRVEPEIAFFLKEPLRGPGVTQEQVLRAVESVVPCFEIIDSRIVDWRIKFVDTVADNGSSARCILGQPMKEFGGLDLRLAGVVLEKNGEVVATGAGAATLGHPAAAVAWLANTLASHGQYLEKGHVVLPGALTTAVPAQAGDFFEASFAGIGSVQCRFTQ